MGETKEEIEAKLSAYIDGQLDAAGRAEIEEHLRQNPQHRRLIEELMKQPKLLGELPREKAPTEVLESLQGQLERSVLLAGINEPEKRSFANRMPQLLGLAAIVALTAGLGVVVYMALPRENPEGFVIVPDPATTTADGPAALSKTPSASAAPLARERAEAEAAQPESDAPATGIATAPNGAAPDRDALSAERAIAGASRTYDDTRSAIVPPPMAAPAAATVRTPAVAQSYAMVTIDVDDMHLAEARVTRLLMDRQLQWSRVDHLVQPSATALPATIDPATRFEAPAVQSPDEPQLRQSNFLVQNVHKSELFDLASAIDGNGVSQLQTGREAEDAIVPIVQRQNTFYAPILPATSQPVQELVSVGDVLGIEVQELRDSPYAPPADNVVRPDGTIVLPMVGPVQVAGLSAEALKDVISIEYEASGVLPSATIRVTRDGVELGTAATDGPTTQPAVDPNAVDVLLVLNSRQTTPIEAAPPALGELAETETDRAKSDRSDTAPEAELDQPGERESLAPNAAADDVLPNGDADAGVESEEAVDGSGAAVTPPQPESTQPPAPESGRRIEAAPAPSPQAEPQPAPAPAPAAPLVQPTTQSSAQPR